MDLVLGFTVGLSIYPINHHVQFSKSYFEKHLENGFYIAIYTLFIPSRNGRSLQQQMVFPPCFLFISHSKFSRK